MTDDQSGCGALRELFTREIRKLEKMRVFHVHLERKRERSGEAQPLEPDPAPDELDEWVRPPLGTRLHWIEARVAFLHRVARHLEGASRREAAFFWLGAACSFLGAPQGSSADLREREDRIEQALEYYSELARVTDAEEDESRLVEEPWDASAGIAPRREMRGAWILREALDMLRDQREAWELLGDPAGE